MGAFISSARTLRTVRQVSALVSLAGGWMPQPGHPIPSAALRGASYSAPMAMRSFSDQPRSNPAVNKDAAPISVRLILKVLSQAQRLLPWR
jgi:hypothetical protein